jgi:hypothetical protein
MRREWNDDEIRRAFAELRKEDERATPGFDATLAAARAAQAATRRNSVPALERRIAAAAAFLLIGSGAVWLTWRGYRGTTESTAMTAANSFSHWRSPTAFLLQGPSSTDMLVNSLPAIAPSSDELKALGVKDPHGGRS